jgi:hypothetical protein
MDLVCWLLSSKLNAVMQSIGAAEEEDEDEEASPHDEELVLDG